MNIIISGKNFEVSDPVRRHIQSKVSRLSRYLPRISEARVEIAREGTRAAQARQVVQITLVSDGAILRGEERSGDVYASLDAALDKIHRQILRYKGSRLRRTSHHSRAVDSPAELEVSEEHEPRIVRTKAFPVRPMREEEAIEQMELLGHDFFIFYNAESGRLNVLYRRRDGNYGLIEPEVE